MSFASERHLPISVLTELPREWPVELLPAIRREVVRTRRKLVILDDDPTGTQTVHGLPVLTHWSEPALVEELRGEHQAFFLLTNSRSLPELQARALAAEVGASLRQAMELSGREAIVVSRSDSTLRGHFPAEVDSLAVAMGRQGLPYLLIPFFLEGGRYTIGDVHYVQEGEVLIPAAQTPFAKDAAFGFSHSNLRMWVEEKSHGRIPSSRVVSISLEDIRLGGVRAVTEKLLSVPPDSAAIVNAASYRDMEVVVAATFAAERRGASFLYRTAASFIRTRVGMASESGLLNGEQMAGPSPHGGLFVIGSYVPKTGQQLARLLADGAVAPVELSVTRLLVDGARAEEISRVKKKVNEFLAFGRDVALYTSRQLVSGADAETSLAIGAIVSRSLIEVVRELTVRPRYLVAKGGITSSDVATIGLGVKRAIILGQALPGVPAWQLGAESRYPGMAYIVFPGNVGDDQALVTLQRTFRRRAPEAPSTAGSSSC